MATLTIQIVLLLISFTFNLLYGNEIGARCSRAYRGRMNELDHYDCYSGCYPTDRPDAAAAKGHANLHCGIYSGRTAEDISALKKTALQTQYGLACPHGQDYYLCKSDTTPTIPPPEVACGGAHKCDERRARRGRYSTPCIHKVDAFARNYRNPPNINTECAKEGDDVTADPDYRTAILCPEADGLIYITRCIIPVTPTTKAINPVAVVSKLHRKAIAPDAQVVPEYIAHPRSKLLNGDMLYDYYDDDSYITPEYSFKSQNDIGIVGEYIVIGTGLIGTFIICGLCGIIWCLFGIGIVFRTMHIKESDNTIDEYRQSV